MPPGGGGDDAALTAAIGWLCRHHRQPFSPVALRARLSAAPSADPAARAVAALSALGFDARSTARRPGALDAGLLPALLFLERGRPAILIGMTDAGQRVQYLEPPGGEPLSATVMDLDRRLTGPVVLAAPPVRPLPGDDDAGVSPHPTGAAWLWSEISRHPGAWGQIALAALGTNLLALAVPVFVMNVFDRVIPNLAMVTLTTLTLGVALALGLDLMLRILRAAVLHRVSEEADLALNARGFARGLSQRLLARRNGAAGAIAALRELETVREFFTSASLVSLIDLAFLFVLLLFLWQLTGVLVWVPALAVPLALGIALGAQVPMARAARRAQALGVRRGLVLQEALTGLETVRSVGGEPVLRREWEAAVAATARVTNRLRTWSVVATSASAAIQQAASVAIVAWGVLLVAEGRISLGALVAANILAGRCLAPLAGISQTLVRAAAARAALRALDGFLATEVEAPPALRSDLRVSRGTVRLVDVGFTYPGAPQPALEAFSATFEAGSATAILGRIGSGKSTLGRLINGSYAATSGLVLIDDHAVAQFDPADLRDGIGYLPQDPVLFTGTLRENLTLGRPDADDAAIFEALRLAGLDRFAATLPEGLNLFVGERGERLSGGQRQAVALARLLLRQPRMLFLDEPTSAMDQEIEATVGRRLAELKARGVGIVLATHRPSLASLADRFIVIDRGRKVLDGPREEVLQALSAADKPTAVEGRA